MSSRRKRNFKKAMKSGLSVGHGMRFLDAFWEILEQNLKSKFESRQHIAFTKFMNFSESFLTTWP